MPNPLYPQSFCYEETNTPVVILVLRNEPEKEHRYHCDALSSFFPDAVERDVPRDGVPTKTEVRDADGVVMTGSTAGSVRRETLDRRTRVASP